MLNKRALDEWVRARLKSPLSLLVRVLIEKMSATMPSGKKQNIDVNIEQTKYVLGGFLLTWRDSSSTKIKKKIN